VYSPDVENSSVSLRIGNSCHCDSLTRVSGALGGANHGPTHAPRWSQEPSKALTTCAHVTCSLRHSGYIIFGLRD